MKLLDVVMDLLNFRSQIKLFHWSTDSYARHIAYDELEHKTTKLVDKLVEVLLSNESLQKEKDVEKLYEFSSDESKEGSTEYLKLYLKFFGEFRKDVDYAEQTIIDEICVNISQCIYRIEKLVD